MKFPSYEEQNKFLDRYVRPLFSVGGIGEIITNYKRDKSEKLRCDTVREMARKGVYKSLRHLETKGTSWDEIVSEMKKGIDKAKYAKLFHFNLEERNKMPYRSDDMRVYCLPPRERQEGYNKYGKLPIERVFNQR